MKYLIFVFQFLIFTEISSQLQTKYIQFYSDRENIYYLDTASVKKVNNIVTCRVNIAVMKSEKRYSFSTSSIRQYLLNSDGNKFYVLGEIQYDSSYKIINSNDSKVVNPSLARQIKSDTVAFSLAKALNSFFHEEMFSFEQIQNEVQINPSKITEEKTELKSDTLIIPPAEIFADTITVTEDKTAELPAETIPENSSPAIKTYDFENETNPEGTIFTDGNLFCFQVSSWKKLSVAESEVNRLIRKGFNAFIVKANLGDKKGVWYRVRVGYFNSKEEAIEIQKKVNLR